MAGSKQGGGGALPVILAVVFGAILVVVQITQDADINAVVMFGMIGVVVGLGVGIGIGKLRGSKDE